MPGVLYAYTLLLLALLIITVLFTNRPTVGDELGLHNPIYMYQHYGRVTYPMQLQSTYMTVHPPTHYFVVGLFAKLGFNVFHAAGIPLAILACIAFWAALTSRFSLPAKLAILTGFTLTNLIWTPLFTIRPDMHVAFAWFAGMMLLESARSLDWPLPRLFAGAFVIAYTSALHYWAVAAVGALVFYCLMALRHPAEQRNDRVFAIISGAGSFYMPFAVEFLYPDRNGIIAMLHGANATGGGMHAALKGHWALLKPFLELAGWPPPMPALGTTLLAPVRLLHIIPLGLASAVLVLNKSLRGFVFPGATLPLFVAIGVSRKAGLYYITPELTLYATALALILFVGLDGLSRVALKGRRLPGLIPAVLVCAFILCRSLPAVWTGLTWRYDDWEVARAASKRIIGPDASVATNQCYLWYTGGASRLYWIVTAPIDWDFFERREAERHFDSVIVLNDWFANRHSTIPFPEFYLDKHLTARGFYFSGHDADLFKDGLASVVHLTPRTGIPVEGFGYDRARGILNHYTQDAGGPWLFVTMKCAVDYPDQPKGAIYLQRFGMENYNVAEPMLIAFVISRDQWSEQRSRFAAIGTIREEVALSMEEISAADLLRTFHDTPIKFADSRFLLPKD
jgi:hypothetical protein